jgi:cytochrome c-type biogenesis protein CcmH/NrfG
MSESARRIAELQRELASNPGSRQFYQLGELLRREGRGVEAADALRSGLAHHPRYVAAWVALGRACVDAGQAMEAVHSLEQAIALDPQNPVAWRLLGEAHLALGERQSALDAMRHCLELVPGDEVLESAVDAIAAEMAAPPPPEEPHAAEPAEEVIESAEVFAPAQEVEAPEPAPAAVEEIEWAPEAAPPAAEVAFPAEAKKSPSADTHRLTVPVVPVAPPGPVTPAPPAPVGQETAEDLFGEPPAAVEAAPEPPDVAQPPAAAPAEVPEPPQPSEAELFTVPEAEEAPALLKKVLQAPTPEPRLDAAAVQPPASLTLARLYVQQQALEEAVLVLERLLEREPGNTEARDLLALVRDMQEPLPEAPARLSRRERRIAALQRWLASLTLGRERATR